LPECSKVHRNESGKLKKHDFGKSSGKSELSLCAAAFANPSDNSLPLRIRRRKNAV
jgi:hypothetical protein